MENTENKPEQKQKPVSRNPVKLSFDFLKEHNKIVFSNDKLFLYNGKHYDEISKNKLGQMIFKFFDNNNIVSQWNTQKEMQIIEAIKRNEKVKEVEFDNYEDRLPLKNGIYFFETKELKPHTDYYFFSYILDVEYNKEASETIKFEQFIYELFQPDDHIDMLSIILQIGGYMIYPKNKINQLFLFLGGGSNGKSLLIEILKAFFPKKYVTSLSLGQLSNADGFQRAPLLRSKINIFAEEKGKKINMEEIKRITAGNQITIQVKFGESIDINPKTKLLGDANDSLTLSDSSDGTHRRLYFIEFKNQFKAKFEYDKIVNPKKKRIFLAKDEDKVLEEILKEKSAILNLLLDGLEVLKNNRWVLPTAKNTETVLEDFKRGSDPLGVWLKNHYIVAPGFENEFETDESKLFYESAVKIVNQFRDFFKTYANKEAMHNANTIGKKIKQMFRVDSLRVYRLENSKLQKEQVTVYPLIKKINIKDYEIANKPVTKKEINKKLFDEPKKESKVDEKKLSTKEGDWEKT